MLILSLPLFWVSLSLPLLALGSAYTDQGRTIKFVGSQTFFHDLLFRFDSLFPYMKSMNLACVLKEATNADSRAAVDVK